MLSQTQTQTEQSTQWGAILLALLYTVSLSMVLAAILGLIAVVFLFSTSFYSIEFDHPVVLVSGIILSQFPIVMGVRHLLRFVKQDQFKHCLLLGMSLILLNMCMKLIFKRPDYASYEVNLESVYLFAILPTVIIAKKIFAG